MSSSVTLTPHPRLFASSTQWARLRERPALPLLEAAAGMVAGKAALWVKAPPLEYHPGVHNSLLLRAREVQTRVWTLLIHWGATGDSACREAALDLLREMGRWEYWGWDRWRDGNTDPTADFDLSYGENCTTLALAYDWLYPTLSESERRDFLETAVKWGFRPFLRWTSGQEDRFWFRKPDSNWNTVCAGGAGLLALALYEEAPEAAEVLARADDSVGYYMRSLEETAGGWPEGIGYWGYGHRYAYYYLLGHERATGRPHPLLELAGAEQTLEFPLEFCPGGRGTGFGDVNTWAPMPFHYAAAARYGRPDLIAALDGIQLRRGKPSESTWPNPAELLLLHPRTEPADIADLARRDVARLYPGLHWGILADRLPDPGLYLSVRGGTTEVPHAHVDLGSFHCVVEGERLIDNITIDGGEEYLNTTFSSRRWELFETQPPSKNVLLVDGVGILRPSSVETRLLRGPGWSAIRLDMAEAMGGSRGGVGVADFYARLFLLLEDRAAVIVDQLKLRHTSRLEARFHTYSPVEFGQRDALIRGQRATLRAAFAATVPSTLYRGIDCLTNPRPDRVSTVVRWCTDTRTHREAALVTALIPGEAPAAVTVQSTPGALEITLPGYRLTLSDTLETVELTSA
jgi:hypothetical protein